MLHKHNDQRLIRNTMFIEPKRFQFVQESAAQILDSAMPSGCAVTIAHGGEGWLALDQCGDTLFKFLTIETSKGKIACLTRPR